MENFLVGLIVFFACGVLVILIAAYLLLWVKICDWLFIAIDATVARWLMKLVYHCRSIEFCPVKAPTFWDEEMQRCREDIRYFAEHYITFKNHVKDYKFSTSDLDLMEAIAKGKNLYYTRGRGHL